MTRCMSGPTNLSGTANRLCRLRTTHLAAGNAVLHSSSQLVVWLYIHYRVWAEKQDTVKLSNAALRSWGVGRKTKYTALRLLADAGLIKVDVAPRRSPVVTLL